MPVRSQGDAVDLLICFNQEAFDLHHHELARRRAHRLRRGVGEGHARVRVPLLRGAARRASPRRRAAAAAARTWSSVGLVCGLLGIDTAQHRADDPQALCAQGRRGRGQHQVAAAPAPSTRATQLPAGAHRLGPPTRAGRGSRCSYRATRRSASARCTRASATTRAIRSRRRPTSSSGLPARLPRFGGAAIQTEDEIAALASVLGASFAGTKAMTATSGPGLSLMAELVGLAGMAEIPAVIVDAQRSGPSTGMPTKTEQSDLNHALYGGHGEAPRVVMAPTSVEDCFHVIVEAFNAAETLPGAGDRAFRPVALAPPRDRARGPTSTDTRSPSASARTGRAGERRLQALRDLRRTASRRWRCRAGPGAYVSTGIEHDEARQPALRAGAARGDDGEALPQARPARAHEGRVTITGPEQADVGHPRLGIDRGRRARGRRDLPRPRAEGLDLLPARAGAAAGRAHPALGAPGWTAIVVPELNVTGQFARLVRAGRRRSRSIRSRRRPGCRSRRAQIADYITDGAVPADDSGVWARRR